MTPAPEWNGPDGHTSAAWLPGPSSFAEKLG